MNLLEDIDNLDTLQLAISADTMYSDLDGETVILETSRGEYFSVDEVGSRIWVLLEHKLPVGEIVQQLLEEFDVDPNRCRREVTAFLQELLDNKLVYCQSSPQL